MNQNTIAVTTTGRQIVGLSLMGLVFYIVSTALSYVSFSLLFFSPLRLQSPVPEKSSSSKSASPAPAPSQECPLNGMLTSQEQADAWYNRRPLVVTLDNHLDARPQWGLSRADVVYEVVAEGGITRLLAVYLCQDADNIAPIRSARTYFLDWSSEYQAVYVHVGGANTPGPADALGQLVVYGIKDLDEDRIYFWRGPERPAPHNVHSSTKNLWQAASNRGWGAVDEKGGRWDVNFHKWQFKDSAAEAGRPTNSSVEVYFWKNYGDYRVKWNYDSKINSYKRANGYSSHIDALAQEQLVVPNVVVQFSKESNVEDGYPGNVHLLYQTIGEGRALIFQDGRAIEGKWTKFNREARTIFTDAKGEEVKFNRGQVWIEVVPEGNSITYSS